MKMKKWQIVVLCSLTLLLVCSLSAGVLGLSFAGVRIAPLERVSEPAEGGSLPDAGFSAYLSGPELDPTELYQRACRQVAYISWSRLSADGNMMIVSGSGIVVSTDGYILTNAHCVADALAAGEPMQVELYGGRITTGTIVGADTETDIALLKIDAVGLSAATLSTAGVKGCQQIYVMGHPNADLKFTMTGGIVSGVDREVSFDDGTVLKMFQLDAAVNPGNSGGPVYDASGKVVGMVTAKFVSLTTEGIGFAIPIQDAVAIAADLKEYGYVTGRPLLGITAVNVLEAMIQPDNPAGVLVHSASPGLAAARAGLQKGDIIVSIDGKTITSLDDLTRVKKEYKAGDTVKVRFWRIGEYMETELTFDEVTPEHPTGPVEVEAEPEEPEAPGEGEGGEAAPEETPDGEGEEPAPEQPDAAP